MANVPLDQSITFCWMLYKYAKKKKKNSNKIQINLMALTLQIKLCDGCTPVTKWEDTLLYKCFKTLGKQIGL